MIRINLLGRPRPKVKRRVAIAGTLQLVLFAVPVLEAVGNTVSLTETLWLTNMDEQADNTIQFKGVAASVDAVANFITNLNRSGYFQNVEMKESVQKEKEGLDRKSTRL